MDKLVLPVSGGLFFHRQDYEHEQAAYRAAIEAVVRPIAAQNGGNMILWGIEITPSGANNIYSEGYAVLNYELCYFPGATVSAFAPYTLVLDVTNDPSATENLANSTSFNARQRRRCKLENNLSGLSVSNNFRYFNMIKFGVESVSNSDEFVLTALNNWAQPSTEQLKLTKNGKKITLWGKLNPGNLSESVYTQIATIPTIYRPLRAQYHIMPMLQGGAVTMWLQPTGELSVINLVGTVVENQTRVLHVPELEFLGQ
jgi:hypothetical protein